MDKKITFTQDELRISLEEFTPSEEIANYYAKEIFSKEPPCKIAI